MKKFCIAVALAVLLLLPLIAVADPLDSGSCGDLLWSLFDDYNVADDAFEGCQIVSVFIGED